MACLQNPISWPSVEITPIWYPFLGIKFLNITFDHMEVLNFSAVGVSGVWIFSACVMVLYVVSMV
jgi:hypothetical protein